MIYINVKISKEIDYKNLITHNLDTNSEAFYS